MDNELSQPLLSICIPTYNREKFIKECLGSLKVENLNNLIEIVVSDNSSTDNTIKILHYYSKILPLRYVVQEKNIGAERNFDAIVQFARGKYCWLLGSDDCLEVNNLYLLISVLQNNMPDVLHFGYIQADINLNALYDVPLKPGSVNQKSEILGYIENLPNMSSMFAFMSTFIFNRNVVWINNREKILKYIGSYYIHMFAIHHALNNGSSLIGLPICPVRARGGNPNEINTIPGKFIEIDSRALLSLAEEVYLLDDKQLRIFSKPFKRSYSWASLLSASAGGGLARLQKSKNTLISFGYSKYYFDFLFLLDAMRLNCIINPIINITRYLRTAYYRLIG